MDLQFAALQYKGDKEDLSCGIWEEEGRTILDTFSLVKKITEIYLQEGNREKAAFLFHENLAELIVKGCEKAREKTSLDVCVLSGGVFQNSLLLRLVKTKLLQHSFKVLSHSLVPPNDGGIALGQALAAMNILNKRS